MNAGSNRREALTQALANAKLDQRPRYVHKYNGVYWIENTPLDPASPLGCSDCIVVWPNGTREDYDPNRGPPSGNSHR